MTLILYLPGIVPGVCDKAKLQALASIRGLRIQPLFLEESEDLDEPERQRQTLEAIQTARESKVVVVASSGGADALTILVEPSYCSKAIFDRIAALILLAPDVVDRSTPVRLIQEFETRVLLAQNDFVDPAPWRNASVCLEIPDFHGLFSPKALDWLVEQTTEVVFGTSGDF